MRPTNRTTTTRATARATTRTTGALAAAVLLTLLTAGCGEQEDCCAPFEPGRSETPTPTVTPSAGATTPPSEGKEKIRVVGQVAEVGDCVVVRDDNDITWTVTGTHADELVLHDRVQVTGAPDLAALGCGGPIVAAVSVSVLPVVE